MVLSPFCVKDFVITDSPVFFLSVALYSLMGDNEMRERKQQVEKINFYDFCVLTENCTPYEGERF
jgi:hypothetical protein